jgi:hypothetical protein
MYTYIVTRTQIYLTPEQERVLARLAKARGTTKARLIREAIDAAYMRSSRQRALVDALAQSAGAWARGASGADYVERLRPGNLARSRAAERR